MGAQPIGGRPSGRRRGRRGRSRRGPMHEINVTPFVDVMLVLLIVFMVTAPLLTVGVPVDLPRTRATPIVDESVPVIITIKSDGTIALQNRSVARADLIPRLRDVAGARSSTRIFVRGDKAAAYGEVLVIMAEIQSAGFDRVALITQLPDS